MKKSVKLPFNINANPKAYHHLAFPMGIIQANAKIDITPWLCGKYINCKYNDNAQKNKFEISLIDSNCVEDGIISLQSLDFYRQTYDTLKVDIIKIFRKMLSLNHYVQCSFNEEFIPGKWAYQKQYFPHDCLLIGYNDIKKVFNSVGYLREGVFCEFDIPYTNMLDAVLSLKRDKLRFNFYKFNENADFSINIKRIVNYLDDYINSKNSLNQYFPPNTKYYGFEGTEKLARYFTQENHVDNRNSRTFMEHKYFMKVRTEYLLKNGYLTDSRFSECAEKVYSMSEKIHLLGMKFNLTKDPKILSRILAMISEALETEKDYLPQVRKQLSQ